MRRRKDEFSFTDEELTAALTKLYEEKLKALPDPEECEHEFSPEFERKMEKVFAKERAMRRMRKVRRWAVAILLLVFISGGVMLAVDVAQTDQMITQFHKEEYSFEELIDHSDVALVGKYVKMFDRDNYYEYKFIVKELLYGEVSETEIYVYENKGIEQSQSGLFQVLGTGEYRKGKEYILIMEKYESILYDHDRYMIAGDLYLCEKEQEYTLYSENISIPEGMTMREYILTLADPENRQTATKNTVKYDDPMEKMAAESQYIGIIEIIALEVEGKVHNGNTYRCRAESLIKGSNMNTYGNGTFLLTLMKGTVNVGESYMIGFSPADGSTSLIYVQATEDSVMAASDENVKLVSELLEK